MAAAKLVTARSNQRRLTQKRASAARSSAWLTRLVNAALIALFRVVGAAHLFIELTQRQPARAIFRFQGEGVFEFADGLVAAAEFFQAQSEILPGPNGLRIERDRHA